MKYFPRLACILYIEVFAIIFYPTPSTENNRYYLLHWSKLLRMWTVMTFPSFRWAQFFHSCICSYFLLSFEISLLASYFFLILPRDILCSLSRNRNQSRAFITTPLQPSISSLEIFKNKRCKAEWRAKVIRNKILHSFPSQTIQGTLLSSWGEKSFWLSLNLFFPAFLFFHHCCETFTPVSGLLSNKKDLQQYKALLNGQMKPVFWKNKIRDSHVTQVSL